MGIHLYKVFSRGPLSHNNESFSHNPELALV